MASVLLAPALAFAEEKGAIETCGWNFFCYGSMLFNWASLTIGWLIGVFAGFLITLAASLIQVLVNLGSQVMSSTLVTEGFRLTLSITNLGFVIAIIVIAFGTMLRLQNYGMKQMLWKLVVAALLVNFSFTFAGIIIDASNVFGNYFLQAASPDGKISKFSENIANSLSLSKLSGINPDTKTADTGGDILKITTAYAGAFIQVGATAIFMTTLVITFFAIAFMLLIRYLYIIFLLIVMPLAWLFWIFPNLSKHTSDWWSHFLKWNFFFPAVSFFLYLSILTSDRVGTVINASMEKSGAIDGAHAASNLASGVLIGFLNIIVQVGMIFGGLMVAQKLGIDGSSAAMKMADQAKGWVIGATGKTIRGATGLTAAQTGGKAIGSSLRTRLINSDTFKGAAGFLSKVPGLRNVAAGMYDAPETTKSTVEARQKEILGQYKSKEALLAGNKAYKYSDTEKAAWAAALAEKGITDKVDPGILDDLLNSARKLGTGQSIAAKDPTLAPKIYREEDVIKKNPELAAITDLKERKVKIDAAAVVMAMSSFKPSDTEKLSPEKVEQLAHLFQQSHRERIAKEGDARALLALAKAAEKLLAEGKADHALVDFATNNPAMQQIILNPDTSKELAKLAEAVAAEKESSKKKSSKIIIPEGSDISEKKGPPTKIII